MSAKGFAPVRWAGHLLLAGALAAACNGSATDGSTCASAGGACLPGPGCGGTRLAPASAQDCSANDPGGRVCCLELGDASSDARDGNDGPG